MCRPLRSLSSKSSEEHVTSIRNDVRSRAGIKGRVDEHEETKLLLLTTFTGNKRRSAAASLGSEEVCDGPLVSNLPPSSFRSSSQLSGSHGPVYAKVNRREGAGGWSPLVSDRYQWLEVDLGRRTQVTAVATQGRYGSSDWLTAYLLMFSDTGHNWRQHRQEDSLGAFPGNSNADTVVQYKLEQPVIARYLRLIPLDWNPTGRIGLRLEIYGCRYTSDVANFDGSSSLVFRLNVRPSRTTSETISLKFKTLRNSGTLLHAVGQRDHSLTLVLEKGRLLLYHQQGVSSSSGGQLLVSLGSLLDDQHWHHVKLERLSTHLNLSVDKNTQQVHTPAELSHWEIHQLSIGAVQSHGLQKPVLSNRNFHGCLENLLYNNINLIKLSKQSNHQVAALIHLVTTQRIQTSGWKSLTQITFGVGASPTF